MNPLTLKEQKFVECVLAGKSQSDAYRAAYPADMGVQRGDNRAIAKRSGEVAHRPHVAAAIAKPRAKAAAKAIAKVEATLGSLSEQLIGIIVAKPKAAPTHGDRIQSMKTLGSWIGLDAPQRIEVKVEGSLLHQIRNKVRTGSGNRPLVS